jgi:hypothetical protein
MSVGLSAALQQQQERQEATQGCWGIETRISLSSTYKKGDMLILV